MLEKLKEIHQVEEESIRLIEEARMEARRVIEEARSQGRKIIEKNEQEAELEARALLEEVEKLKQKTRAEELKIQSKAKKNLPQAVHLILERLFERWPSPE